MTVRKIGTKSAEWTPPRLLCHLPFVFFAPTVATAFCSKTNRVWRQRDGLCKIKQAVQHTHFLRTGAATWRSASVSSTRWCSGNSGTPCERCFCWMQCGGGYSVNLCKNGVWGRRGNTCPLSLAAKVLFF